MVLEGAGFAAEIEIICEGMRVLLTDPYLPETVTLQVRRAGSDQMQNVPIPAGEDDMYLNELSAFIEAVRSSDTSGIRSPYDDALKTYELTQIIAERARSAK